jgi:hypothetical protein
MVSLVFQFITLISKNLIIFNLPVCQTTSSRQPDLEAVGMHRSRMQSVPGGFALMQSKRRTRPRFSISRQNSHRVQKLH